MKPRLPVHVVVNHSAALLLLSLLCATTGTDAFCPRTSPTTTRTTKSSHATPLALFLTPPNRRHLDEHTLVSASNTRRRLSAVVVDYDDASTSNNKRTPLLLQQRQQSQQQTIQWRVPLSQEPQQLTTTPEINNMFTAWAPVLSAACLITGNTVGAGCLVLPELAVGPGLLTTTALFLAAWTVNVLSALLLAQVAIAQNDNSATVPSSFRAFASTSLNSAQAGSAVSALSVFVNSCVLAFDLSRAGTLGHGMIDGLNADTTSVTTALVVVALLTTLRTSQLSSVCNLLVMGLFVSFGGLLLPGLANVADPMGTLLQPGLDPATVWTLAPVVLMSMIFQNIVPTVCKLLDYDKSKTVCSIVLGSAIPLVMYLAWILVNLGGGIDSSVMGTAAPILTLFSLSTLGGSTLCSSMSLAEELEQSFGGAGDNATKATDRTKDSTFGVPAVAASVALPLVVTLLSDSETGLTSALSLAGSFGSPLLYGVLPCWMAHAQSNKDSSWIPRQALPVLGGLSSLFVGQELFSMLAV